jgi:uncharacterized protein YjbI with pentapeptide repeats
MRSTGLAHASLRGANLSNVNITRTILRMADFTGLRSSAVVSGRLLPGWVNVSGHLVGPSANLSGTDLSYGHFGRSILHETNLIGANLTGANLSVARLARVRTGHLIVQNGPAPFLPKNWTLRRGYLLGPGADLSGAVLQNLKLAHTDLASTLLRGADLQNAVLTYANLTRAELVGVNLQHANLAHASLGGVISSHIIGVPLALPPHWAIVKGRLVRH